MMSTDYETLHCVFFSIFRLLSLLLPWKPLLRNLKERRKTLISREKWLTLDFDHPEPALLQNPSPYTVPMRPTQQYLFSGPTYTSLSIRRHIQKFPD
jgi:hypothetical protein